MGSWSVDKSGRFPMRLFLTESEINRDCERLVTTFLQERYGEMRFPISTDDLTVLVERYCTSLDRYADLSGEGDDVEGVTFFQPDEPPEISISIQLTEQAHRHNRLRTTLAHELGHAFFHRAVFDRLFAQPADLYEAARADPRTVCKRATMVESGQFDWLEWQAGYFSGALLMPAQLLRRSVGDFLREQGIHGAAVIGTPAAAAAEQHTTDGFQVSAEAARVRLRKLGLVADTAGPATLFG